MYKFNSSTEDICIRKIEAGLIGIKNNTKTLKEANINYFLDKLRPLNKEMHDELQMKYITIVKEKSDK